MAETQVEEKAHVQELLPVIEYGHGVWHRWQAEAVMGSSSGFVSLQWLVCTGTHVPRGCPESPACARQREHHLPSHTQGRLTCWIELAQLLLCHWHGNKGVQARILSRAKYSKNNSWLLKDSYSNSV